MIYFFKRRQGWLFVVLVLFCGCSLKYQRQIPPHQLPLSPEKTLDQMLERRDAFQDVRGKAAITITQQGKKQRFLANLVFDSSYRFRMEGLGFGDTPYFFLVADDNDQLWFYVPDQKKIWRGKASAENLFQLTGILLEPETLVGLLSGNLPAGLPAESDVSFSAREGFIQFPFGRQGWYRLWMDTDRGVMVKVHIYGADKKLCLIVRFDDYEKAGSYEWPRQIECDFVSSKVQLKVKYKRLFLNSGVTESSFRLHYPSGTMIENIDTPWLDEAVGEK